MNNLKNTDIMKNQFLATLLVTLSLNCFGQDTLNTNTLHQQFFSLSPISKKVGKVNGLAFGVGHVENRNVENQTINGLNLEANPAPLAIALIAFIYIPYLPERIINNSRKHDSISKHNFVIKNWSCSQNLKVN